MLHTLVLLTALLAAAEPTAPSHWADLRPGPHAVGFEDRWLRDGSRTFGGPGTGRPIRVLIWYPALQGDARPPLRLIDLIRLPPPEPSFAAYAAYLEARDLEVAGRQIVPPREALTARLLALPSLARRGLAPAPGRHPLVLHLLGRNDYQQESTVLWSYLASHGYLVAVVPQMGPSLERPRLAFSAPDVDLQRRDAAFVLDALAADPRLDARRIALAGHSSGAVAAVLLAAGEPRVRAIVSLEGSINTAGAGPLLEAAGWRPDAVTVPILQLYDRANQQLDWHVLDALAAADRYHVGFGTLEPGSRTTHFDFQNWPLFPAHFGVEDVRARDYRPSALGRTFYLTACRLSERFLAAVLAGDHAAREVVTGTAALPGIDPALLTFRLQPRSTTP